MADVEDIKVGDLAITVFFSDGIKVLLLPYASERDFVARFILPKLQEAGQSLGVHDVVDIYFEKTQNGTPDISMHDCLKPGTLSSIIERSGIPKDEFLAQL